RGRAGRGGRRMALDGPPQQLHAQVEQIGRAADAQHVIGRLRGGQQRPQAQRGHHAPDQAAGADAQAGQHGAPAALDGGGAQHQGGVQSRRQRQDAGGKTESDQGGGGRHGGLGGTKRQHTAAR